MDSCFRALNTNCFCPDNNEQQLTFITMRNNVGLSTMDYYYDTVGQYYLFNLCNKCQIFIYIYSKHELDILYKTYLIQCSSENVGKSIVQVTSCKIIFIECTVIDPFITFALLGKD